MGELIARSVDLAAVCQLRPGGSTWQPGRRNRWPAPLPPTQHSPSRRGPPTWCPVTRVGDRVASCSRGADGAGGPARRRAGASGACAGRVARAGSARWRRRLGLLPPMVAAAGLVSVAWAQPRLASVAGAGMGLALVARVQVALALALVVRVRVALALAMVIRAGLIPGLVLVWLAVVAWVRAGVARVVGTWRASVPVRLAPWVLGLSWPSLAGPLSPLATPEYVELLAAAGASCRCRGPAAG